MQPLSGADLHSVVLVRDSLEAAGAFLIAHALKLVLGSSPSSPVPSRRVVLLAAAQAAPHYAAVLRKAGLSLPSLTDTGRLTVVDVLSLLAGGAPEPPSLAALHQRLAAAVAAGSSNTSGSHATGGPVCLVADDLTALRCLAADPADWAAFLHGCVALGSSPGCCFVGLAHADVADDEAWLARLEHAAALVLDVEPLESGSSADTTGRVLVTRRDVQPAAAAATAAGTAAGGGLADGDGPAAPGSLQFTYKLADAGARYVLVG